MTLFTPTLLDFSQRANGPDAVVTGTVKFKPTARQVDPPVVIVEDSFTVVYLGVPVVVQLAIMPEGWGWEVTENIEKVRAERIIKNYGTTQVDYADLPSLDKADFNPQPYPPSPAWVVEAARLQAEIDAGGGGGWPRYVFTQAAPSATWTINHNLNAKPDFTFFLTSDPTRPVYTDVTYPSLNTAVAVWPSAESGTAES